MIITHTWEAHADNAAALEAKGEDYQWQAKAEYEAAKAAGGTERAIAERVGKSAPHVHYVLTAVSKAEAEAEGLSFAEAYRAVCYIGENVDTFCREFATFGTIWTPRTEK